MIFQAMVAKGDGDSLQDEVIGPKADSPGHDRQRGEGQDLMQDFRLDETKIQNKFWPTLMAQQQARAGFLREGRAP